MKRVPVQPRENIAEATKNSGILQLTKNSPDGESITWDETSAYVFSRKDIDHILGQVEPLVKMSHQAVDFLLDGEWGTLGLPRNMFELVRNSFDDEYLDLYTRYDFAYMIDGSLKLVGIDADSPRSFIETAHAQRVWLYDKFEQQASNHSVTQMNKIPEVSIEAFRRLKQMSRKGIMHFANNPDIINEDHIITKFIKGVAEIAGWETEDVRLKDITWNAQKREWLSTDEKVVNLFKYFPWEILLSQPASKKFITHENKFNSVFEPSWKMMLSNRAMFPALHHLYPNSPIISKSYIDEPYDLEKEDFVKFTLLPSTSRSEIALLKGKEFTSWGDQMRDLSQQSVLGYRKLEIPRRFQNSDEAENNPGRKMFCYLSVFAVAGNIAGIGMKETKLPLLGSHATFRPHLVIL